MLVQNPEIVMLVQLVSTKTVDYNSQECKSTSTKIPSLSSCYTQLYNTSVQM